MTAPDQTLYRCTPSPLHALLLAGSVPLFLGALLSDIAYYNSYQIQWSNFAAWLIAGALVFCGLALLFALANLWLVLWPHQKKLLGFVPATLEERVRCSRITFLSSRSNTILSMPLLFLMAAGGHGLQLFS